MPGQEWRTFWDSGRRFESELPARHEAMVVFRDSQGNELGPLRSVLDWSAHEDQTNLEVYGVHHGAEALREINKTLAGWRRPGHRGLAATVWDGDAKDARQQEHLEAEADPQQPSGPEGDS